MTKALQDLGVQVAFTSDGALDFVTTLERLKAAGMGAAEATHIFGLRGASAGVIMAEATEKMRLLEWQAVSNVTALDDMVKVMTGDLWSALVRARSAFEALGMAIGGPWFETLRDVVDGFANVVRGIATFLLTFNTLLNSFSAIFRDAFLVPIEIRVAR